MPGRAEEQRSIKINRAPVLTLWAAVVAERLGFDWEEALTLGRAVAGLNAYSKGVSIGLFKPSPREVHERRRKLREAETLTVDLLHRAVPAVRTEEGLRALSKDKPMDPKSAQSYLEGKFGDALDGVCEVMKRLAKSMEPAELAEEAYALYEKFRPGIPSGKRGWEAAGTLNLDTIRGLAKESG
jgi:hypothetical protein